MIELSKKKNADNIQYLAWFVDSSKLEFSSRTKSSLSICTTIGSTCTLPSDDGNYKIKSNQKQHKLEKSKDIKTNKQNQIQFNYWNLVKSLSANIITGGFDFKIFNFFYCWLGIQLNQTLHTKLAGLILKFKCLQSSC